MVCWKCNKDIESGAKFCPYCGVSQTEIPNNDVNDPYEENPVSDTGGSGVIKPRPKALWVILPACVVVVIIVIVLVTRNKQQADKYVDNTKTYDISTESYKEETTEKEKDDDDVVQEPMLSDENQIVETDISQEKVLAMYESFISYIEDGGFPNQYASVDDIYDYRHDDSSEYTLYDIDNDGRIELLIKMHSRSIASDSFFIIECNPDIGDAKIELQCFCDIDIRDNGIIIGYASHNLGLTNDDWDCSVYEYNAAYDYYAEIEQSTRGEMGDYYPDKLEWHNVNESVFDSSDYLNAIRDNVSEISNGEGDMLFDIIEKGSLHELMSYYASKGMYGIKQEENGELRFFGNDNDDETLYCNASEGGYVSYKKQINGLTIAGIYPGMSTQEAEEILNKIGLIHIAGTTEYYVKFYGKDAFGIYISEADGVVSDIELFEGYYLRWYMSYDTNGFYEYGIINDRPTPEFSREGSAAVKEKEVYAIDSFAEMMDFEDIQYNTAHHEVKYNISILEISNSAIKCEIEIVSTDADVVYFNIFSGSLYDKNKNYMENGYWGMCDSTEDYTREYVSGSAGDTLTGYLVLYEPIKNIDDLGYITVDYIEYNPKYSDDYILEHYEEVQKKVWIKIQ